MEFLAIISVYNTKEKLKRLKYVDYKKKTKQEMIKFFCTIFYFDKPCFSKPGKMYEDSGSAL